MFNKCHVILLLIERKIPPLSLVLKLPECFIKTRSVSDGAGRRTTAEATTVLLYNSGWHSAQ